MSDKTSADRIQAGITRANDMVIGASMAIMSTEPGTAARTQAEYFQSLFSRIRDVLQEADRNRWEPGAAPEAWESFDSSRTVLELADAVVGASEDGEAL